MNAAGTLGFGRALVTRRRALIPVNNEFVASCLECDTRLGEIRGPPLARRQTVRVAPRVFEGQLRACWGIRLIETAFKACVVFKLEAEARACYSRLIDGLAAVAFAFGDVETGRRSPAAV